MDAAANVAAVFGNISMDLEKIQQVIVGDEMKPPLSTEVNPEHVDLPVQPYYDESLQCFQCFITFSDPKSKERHLKKHHRNHYVQLLQQTNILFTCYKCDKTFHSSEELNQHQVTHNTEKTPIFCKDCQKTFSTFSQLSIHESFKCNERKYACKNCGVLFHTGFRLQHHCKAVHRGNTDGTKDINTFLCCKCSCGFRTEEELLQHQEMFASDQNCGLKPESKKRASKPKCASEKIEQEDRAKRLREESSSAELNIPCPKPDCDCTFPSVEALRAHKQDKHSPILHKAPSSEYSCPTCGKSFARERSLKSHQASHKKGEKVADVR